MNTKPAKTNAPTATTSPTKILRTTRLIAVDIGTLGPWSRQASFLGSPSRHFLNTHSKSTALALTRMVAKLNAMNKTAACSFLWLCLAYSCSGQSQEALCPKHIEVPVYPILAKTAHITGKVVLIVTLDIDGKVSDVKVANEDDKGVGLLKLAVTDNIRHWTFAKPPAAPYTQTIVYDFEFDPSLPADDGNHSIVRVTFDLPDRISISTNLRIIDHSPGNEDKIKKKHWWQ
jgi:TonB family protein